MASSSAVTRFALVSATLAAACVRVDGGAVELSWVVQSRAGAAITDCGCADPPIHTVRLVLVGVGGSVAGHRPCDGTAQCDFPCHRQTGSTAFDVRETGNGEAYEISVLTVDESGVEIPSDQVMSPAPILREVVKGQVTETEAFQLVAGCRAECGMNGSGVCARP
jgi:hypothetical protein